MSWRACIIQGRQLDYYIVVSQDQGLCRINEETTSLHQHSKQSFSKNYILFKQCETLSINSTLPLVYMSLKNNLAYMIKGPICPYVLFMYWGIIIHTCHRHSQQGFRKGVVFPKYCRVSQFISSRQVDLYGQFKDFSRRVSSHPQPPRLLSLVRTPNHLGYFH
jgi:hypothetical protein